ncbi:MAG: hypothetical protein JSV89_20160 [Spirochaetaceae bacterium]|nr:MAG: hypothetical protein JSV89_20160 [Spirochaetaceae bacterium]
MQRLLRLSIYILMGGLLLVSCSDVSMFTPSVKESVGIRILSLSEGDFLGEDDSVDFIIQTEDQSTEPELLEIELIAQSGQSVWNTSISSPLTDEELELLLPDLEAGQYTIVFTVHDTEGGIEEEEISFFYVTGQYAIKGISSYPPTSVAGHETVIEADLLFPSGANPYIRWSQDEVILAKGPVADGLKSITWVAPAEEGVYSIRVELFPVPPPGGTDFTFSSSLSLAAQLFVTTASLLTEDELLPEDSYYSLFHLNGTLRNSGLLGKDTTKVEAKAIGQAVLSNENGIMGYQTGSGAGLLYPLNVLPIFEGKLSPCTITFKLVSKGEKDGENLLTIDGGEGFRLRIFFDSEEQLVATIAVGNTLLKLPSNIFGLKVDEHHRLDLSLVPTEEGLRALWFLNGRQTASLLLSPLPADLPLDGETIVAGEKGFTGIVTELGVYFRDALNRPSVDPGIYRAAMRQRYGRRLVLAEGFEGLYLPDPDSWRLTSADSTTLRGGQLVLPSSARLTLPFFEVGREDTVFLIEFQGEIPPGSTLALQWEGAEQPFLVIDPTGEIFSQARESEEFSPAGMNIQLTLTRSSVSLATADAPIRYSFEAPGDRSNWLSVALLSPERNGNLQIDTILIVQEQES